jgi:DNA-binding IclR family transcriptional regulator
MSLQAVTRNTLVDKLQLEASLEHIAQTGVGVDDEEFVAGMVALSVPILSPEGHYFASLFTHAPTVRKSLADLQVFVPKLKVAANELTLILKDAASSDSQ